MQRKLVFKISQLSINRLWEKEKTKVLIYNIMVYHHRPILLTTNPQLIFVGVNVDILFVEKIVHTFFFLKNFRYLVYIYKRERLK